MAFRILPKDGRFFELFVTDAENLRLAAHELREMVERFDRLEARVAHIQALEKRGDEIDREINDRLEKSFVTPFDREDIHELTVRLDDVVDSVQAVAETLLVYAVSEPTDECRRLAQILAAQADELAVVMSKLESKKGLSIHLEAIHRLEHEADGLSRAAVARLFRNGSEPIDVIKWRDLYRELENGIDAAEDAAEAVERMLHKAT